MRQLKSDIMHALCTEKITTDKMVEICDICDKHENTRPGWVSVEDRLPKPNKHCLTYSKDISGVQYRILMTNNGHFHSDVTHWMQLPDAPPEGKHE